MWSGEVEKSLKEKKEREKEREDVSVALFKPTVDSIQLRRNRV